MSIYSVSFVQYLFPFIKTPMFIGNSLYDTAQLLGILGLDCLPPNCSEDMLKFFYEFKHVRYTLVSNNVS